jgi:hypothetical protein
MLIALLGAANLPAATLAGLTLPDSAKVRDQTLVLNGMGLLSKKGIKEYVAGLYLGQKSNNAEAIIEADAPKRIVLHFTREVDQEKLKKDIGGGFDVNARATLKAQIDQFTSGLETLNAGEEMAITYLPGTGTILAVKGKDKLTIPGLPFGQAVFVIWLGEKSPSTVKKGILGQ